MKLARLTRPAEAALAHRLQRFRRDLEFAGGVELKVLLADADPERARIVSMPSAAYNTFNLQRHLISRRTLRLCRAEAMAHWQAAAM